MRNVIIAMSIFIIMVVALFFSMNYLGKTCKALTKTCDTLEEIINEDKWDESYDESLKLLEELKDKWSILSIFINHQEIDNMVNELFKFTQYVKTQSKDESLASLHVIKFYIENIETLQKVSIQNIL